MGETGVCQQIKLLKHVLQLIVAFIKADASEGGLKCAFLNFGANFLRKNFFVYKKFIETFKGKSDFFKII